jgi:carbon monoxide dehydrogenase subunit G
MSFWLRSSRKHRVSCPKSEEARKKDIPIEEGFMIIEGGFVLKAPIEKLFDFLLKPETIMTCLPGAESVKLVDESTYECVVKQKVGPISAKLKFVNRLTKVERPTHIEIKGEGEDVTKLGHFKQKTLVDLREASPGQVEITYKSDVNIVGKLAMFGDRVMRSKAKQVEEEFTKNLQEKLRDVV